MSDPDPSGPTEREVQAPLTCGAEITQDTTLEADLVCGRGPGLVVTADNVTLDLGGHTVSGDPLGRDRGPGIVLRGVTGATVRNGTVREFDAGVVIDGGSGNTVENLTVEDNVGSADGDYGDGIVVNESRANRILANMVHQNGPFSGISLGPQSQANEVRGNTVSENNMLQAGEPGLGRQTIGIRVEGPSANHNRILDNTVSDSGGDGIAVLATCDDFTAEPPCAGTPPNEYNEIVGNRAYGNGKSGMGAGIRLFSMPDPMAPVHNTIRDNVADRNTNYGIAIDDAGPGEGGNLAVGNRAHDNGEFDGSDGAIMPPCGRNVWEDNDFGSVNQPCITERKEPRE